MFDPLSGRIHKYGGIRPPIHPRWLRCAPLRRTVGYASVARLASGAARRSRCVTVFVNSTT
jgi:hypothetical protein